MRPRSRCCSKAEARVRGYVLLRAMDTQANQCGFGKSGVCCRICYMGPCRITPKAPAGVCGADADTIVARNYLREVAGGTAAHSDHGRHLVLLLKKVAEGKGGSYRIKDEPALRCAARALRRRGGRTARRSRSRSTWPISSSASSPARKRSSRRCSSPR